VSAKNFAHASFCAIALHRNADGRGRGNHAHTRPWNWGRNGDHSCGNFGRAPIPPERERTTILTTPLLSRFAKVTLPAQMLLGTETHGAKQNTDVVVSDLGSNNRQALTALATAGGENFTATSSGLTGAETDFTGALFAVWTECRLHGCKTKKGSEMTGALRACQGTV